MIQAARSGRANIAEGSENSLTSKGKHRSVFMAEELARRLRGTPGVETEVVQRGRRRGTGWREAGRAARRPPGKTRTLGKGDFANGEKDQGSEGRTWRRPNQSLVTGKETRMGSEPQPRSLVTNPSRRFVV